ncbi:MAG: NAD(P)H-dependent oxidoreductase [Dehalococcoidales bacterium]|nr:NAD(P)H-dependent oxidoreductase [Dehalococcoidales bacterium]
MKILGLSCGRKLGNSELLTIEALTAAKNLGVDVELIRLSDLSIKPCKGCLSCIKSYSMNNVIPGKCVIKDDVQWFSDRLLDADGVIIASPIYTGQPSGYFRLLCDRMGPTHDVGFQLFSKHKGNKMVDERFFKPRVAGTIVAGGAVECDQQLALPTLQESFLSSMIIPVVDHFAATNVSAARQVLLNDKHMKRAANLGRNVAKSLGNTIDNVKFLGDNPGICPVCHENILFVGRKKSVVCPICGIKGIIELDGDEVKVIYTQEEIRSSRRISIETRIQHIIDIGDWHEDFETGSEKVESKFKKYKSFNNYAKPQK